MTYTNTISAQTDRALGPRNVGYGERMASAIGGPALALYGLARGGKGGIALALLGAEIFYRGMTGRCPFYRALGISTAAQPRVRRVEQTVTIARPAEELYRFWRNFENLPRFMKHLQSVTTSGDSGQRSHWVASAPAGASIAWDAEITQERANELIAWRSLEGAQVENSGFVLFAPAPGERGTLVRVELAYTPPAGALGVAVARLFGEEPGQQVAGDLRRFKQLMEAGEIPTTSGQPAGQRSTAAKLLASDEEDTQAKEAPSKPLQQRKPAVEESSEGSFPASDPPAWTGVGAAGGDERTVGA